MSVVKQAWHGFPLNASKDGECLVFMAAEALDSVQLAAPKQLETVTNIRDNRHKLCVFTPKIYSKNYIFIITRSEM